MRDKNGLPIDADVEHPNVSKKLGIKQLACVIGYLEGDNVTFADTDMSNLSETPVGKKHKYSTDFLARQRMYLFAEEVSKHYKDRINIFDSLSLPMAVLVKVLAELVSQVVLVIAAEVISQTVISEFLSKLANCDVVMMLLNKARKDIDIYGYGHNYGYGKYGLS